MTEPIYRRPAKNGDEMDAFSRKARRHLCALQRSGVVHATKTRAARRVRRQERQALRVAGHWAIKMVHAAGRADVDGILAAYDRVDVA